MTETIMLNQFNEIIFYFRLGYDIFELHGKQR